MKKLERIEPEGFVQFYQFWKPHKRHTCNSSDARASYVKALLRGADPAEILDGAKGYITFMPEKDKPYIQLAQTFLNKSIYEDWFDRWREHEKRLAEQAQPNVVAMRATPVLPATHFSLQWAQKKQESA